MHHQCDNENIEFGYISSFVILTNIIRHASKPKLLVLIVLVLISRTCKMRTKEDVFVYREIKTNIHYRYIDNGHSLIIRTNKTEDSGGSRIFMSGGDSMGNGCDPGQIMHFEVH